MYYFQLSIIFWHQNIWQKICWNSFLTAAIQLLLLQLFLLSFVGVTFNLFQIQNFEFQNCVDISDGSEFRRDGKGLPKLRRFAPGPENWPNRKAYKAEILHGGLEYPNDKVRLAKDCLKLHLKKVNFLQFFEPKFGIF